ncbi:MAG: hypothetical protein JST54_09425 [Deltaproteobacteria bacterium]|nr:hypothetical protein [Deltaproteobacteria bacterium]
MHALLALTLLAAPAAPTTDDPVLRALVDELGRAKTLKMDTVGAPYYASGSVTDISGFSVSASFGAVTHRGHPQETQVHVDTRVGAPDLDSSSFGDGMFSDMYGRPGGAPDEPDYDALRQALWLKLDTSYKGAIEALARKRAYLETHASADRPADFSAAPVTSVLLPRVKVSVDEERWTKAVKAASAVFRDAPGVQSGWAAFSARAINACFASTDPVQDRFGDTQVRFDVGASMQAADGMELEVSVIAVGRSESDLPKDAALLQATKEALTRLQALAKAPTLAEDYSGPVLFTGRAADTFFLRGIALPLSGAHPIVGVPHEGRLTDRLNKHITSPMLTLRDDPTQKTWKGKPLLGWYPVDDQGVKPVPLTLVSKGVLQTYFMSRAPTLKVAQSNGHARGSTATASNLFVEASEGKSRDALKKQLVQLAKEDDQDYGILVDELYEAGERGYDMGGESGNVSLPPPVVAYRVYPDGREELIRGATFKPFSFQSLKDIVAVGKEPTLLNTQAMGQPVSVVAPAVLVKHLELRKPSREFEKPPLIARPVVSEK